MALSAKLDLRQTQALVMTPLLMQSIRLLQLTHVELEQFIEQEIEKNPLLERDDVNSEHFALDERGFNTDRISSDERDFSRNRGQRCRGA